MSLDRLPKPAHLALLTALLAPALWPAEARASSVIVPDAFPTIQAALNSMPDTVLVRAGTYAETPVVFAKVVLRGTAGNPALERPLLTALRIAPVTGDLPTLTVEAMDFTGPVTIQNNVVPSFIVFFLCRLHGGVADLSTSTSTAGITLRNCKVEGDAVLQADGDCVVDLCKFDGRLFLSQPNCRLVLTSTEFTAITTGAAVSTQGSAILSATVRNNIVRGRASGITLFTTQALEMTANLVQDCAGEGLHARGDHVVIQGNTVERCAPGMKIEVGRSGTITGNVVHACAGDGITLFADQADTLLVKNNTSAFNAGAGFISSCHVGERFEFAANIGAGNQAFGLRWVVPEVALVQCNDWFGNTPGDVQGQPPSTADLALYPRFCDVAGGDFHLASGSALVNRPGCGTIGALGAGCAATTDAGETLDLAFRLGRVEPDPASGPVRIEFELAHEAAVQLEIFDVQGRLVASPAQGVWPAGRHAVVWPGAAAGVYLVRYRYPGGHDTRPLVRIR